MYELYVPPDSPDKLSMVEALKEEASVVAEDLGFEQNDVGDGKGSSFHVISRCKVQEARGKVKSLYVALERTVRIRLCNMREISSAS